MNNKKYIILLLLFLLCGLPANSSYISSMGASIEKPSTIDVENVDFGPYMRHMQRKIKQNWQPQSLDNPTSVVLRYKIMRNGELGDYSVLKSSGNADLDNSAIQALIKSFPLRPLPCEYKQDSIEVQFTFNYNVREK